jgi:hypothetical protein
LVPMPTTTIRLAMNGNEGLGRRQPSHYCLPSRLRSHSPSNRSRGWRPPGYRLHSHLRARATAPTTMTTTTTGAGRRGMWIITIVPPPTTHVMRDCCCRPSAARVSSAGRRAPIVIVRIMPPPGRWAMDGATYDATETYGSRGGMDGDGMKRMMLRNHCCWCFAACVSSVGRRAPIVVVRIMPPRRRGPMDGAADDATETYGSRGG